MPDWLAGVDLLDPEAVGAAARPVMARMSNPNGLDRAESCYQDWLAIGEGWAYLELPGLKQRTRNALEAIGVDLMDSDDWRESATGVRG